MKRVKRQRSARFYKTQAIGAMIVLSAVSLMSLGLTEQQQRAASRQEAKTSAERANSVQREHLASDRAQELETPNAVPPSSEPSADETANTNGQYPDRPTESTKPGDVIATDRAKGTKTYWMGGLNFSQSTVTYSLAKQELIRLTLTTQDGKAITAPTSTWDVDDSSIWLVQQGGNEPNTARTSWTLYVDAEEAKTGTYKAYVVAVLPANNGGDRYEYSGYLTVNVVE